MAVSLSSTTYSLFINVDDTNEFTYKTGILDLEFIEGNGISLDNTFPMNDTKGMKNEPYTLVIKNTGTLAYIFDIKMLGGDDENTIDTSYIKVSVNDERPFVLKQHNNTLKSNLILYPKESITLKVKVWLDINTPNEQLGKYFQAKLVTNGTNFYRTLDNSGANHPILNDNMISIYYDQNTKEWKKADESNMDLNYEWYNYNTKKWANSVIVKDSGKQIYDISNNRNNINIKNDLDITNGNITLNNSNLDIDISNTNNISIITRLKFNDLKENNKIIVFDNGYILYNRNSFIINNNGIIYETNQISIDNNNYYILSYTNDNNEINLYLNGINILKKSSKTNNNYSRVTYGNNTNITISDIYIYNTILNNDIISTNYKDNIVIYENNLLCGYNDFYPMTVYDHYKSSNNGTVINSDDIKEFYVWIPRFKYRLWNVMGEVNHSEYDAYQKGIDISFENYANTSGTIYCKDLKCYSDEELTTQVTSLDNGKYYTHPAFTSLDNELYGLWIGKYELSSSDCNEDNCLNTNSNFNIIDTKQIWNNNYLSNYYKSIKQKEEKYHIIKNIEWGAIAYLSHSKYGVCNNKGCNYEIDSTTNNIYGIYNMNGNYSEFVMANYADSSNSVSLNNSHFDIPLLNSDYDLYINDSFILGDATKEIMIDSSNNGGWYNNRSIFIDSINNWFIRGNNTNELNQIFYYNASTDNNSKYITTRIVIR